MKIFIKFSYFFLPLILITSCKTKIIKENLIEVPADQESEKSNTQTSKMEVRYSCGDDEISKFINEGWTIVEEYSQEKICTWKSIPATKDCDMEKDKGCKITIPDKIGKEKIYFLEK